MQARYVPPSEIHTREELIRVYSCWNHHAEPEGAWRQYTLEELENSPSRQDGLDAGLEKRWKGLMVNLIWKVGEALTSPMVTLAAAAIFLRRFYGERSMVRNDKLVVATACLFLAGKVEDTPRSLQRIAETMYKAFCLNVANVSKEKADARWEDTAYQENFKAAVLAAERALLFTLGFNFRIDTPHKCLFNVQGIAHQLQGPIEQACAASKVDLHPAQIQQAAYDLCNECLRSDVVMTHTPLEITVASMYFSLKYHVISHLMPGGMRWYTDWSLTEDRIEGIIKAQTDMYIECKAQDAAAAAVVQSGAPANPDRAVSAAVPLPDSVATPQQQQAWLNAKATIGHQHAKQSLHHASSSHGSGDYPQPSQSETPAASSTPAQPSLFMPRAASTQRNLDHRVRNDRRSAERGASLPVPKFAPVANGVKKSEPGSPAHVEAPPAMQELIETDMF